jgi:hypothetical protein
MRALAISCLHLALCAFLPPVQAQDEPFPSGAFASYLMKAANPGAHGLRNDRYFPYPSPEGFRIAYRQPVLRNEFFRDGWPVSEAQQAFREQLEATIQKLRSRLAGNSMDFDALPLDARELLVDLSVFDGVESLSDEQIRVIVALQWDRILTPEFYARHIADWPDSDRNKAFYERWKR